MAAAIVAMAVSCVEESFTSSNDTPKIYAETAEPITRTSIDNGTADQGGSLAMLWTPGDKIGAFTESNKNIAYTLVESSPVVSGSFSTTETVNGEISCAYYPYDSVNSSKDAGSLVGKVQWEQTMLAGAIPCDYKWGKPEGVDNSGNFKIRFHNMFSLVRFKIDATGTALAGETLESVSLTVTRADGTLVPVTGEFFFNATNGTYDIRCTTSEHLNTTSNFLKTIWNETLDGEVSRFATVFPEIKVGDKLNFTIKTSGHQATLSVTSKVNFEAEKYYTFPLKLANFSKLEVMEKVDIFTAATYNIDGLPKKVSIFTINGDGPGSDGTKIISNRIASDNWDFVGFSEDFAYHTELTSALSAYTFGKYRGNISSKALTSTIDTDGLGFAARNATCSFSNENIVKFTSSAGGISSGANTCIEKGFRHYVVTLSDEIKIDVIITHMNTYSSSGSSHINAQHAQLKQVAQYINGLKANNRPIIFMGDTNCRYNRHNFQEYFWGVLDSTLEVQDTWVEHQWAGIYPTYLGKSLMVSDATGTDSDTDVILENTQRGEVVDKIIYINNPSANVQISANSFLRDMNYDKADHKPIVSEFTYYKKQ